MSPDAGIRHIRILAAGRESDSIRHGKSIGSHRHGAGAVVVPVDLGRHAGSRAEVVGLAVGRVGEVDVEVSGVDGHIVERVELASEEVVEQNGGVVRLNRVHDDQRGLLLGTLALSGEENLALVLVGAWSCCQFLCP